MAAICVIVIAQAACNEPIARVKLRGDSMMPNFAEGDVFVIAEMPVTELERGDVVLVEAEGGLLIKRLIGLPGETISIRDGNIFINGTSLVEPYEVMPPTYTVDELTLDSDSYFVLGDNRDHSSDSHIWGPVHGSAIKGKATPE